MQVFNTYIVYISIIRKQNDDYKTVIGYTTLFSKQWESNFHKHIFDNNKI